MGRLEEILAVPPPPAYDTVVSHRTGRKGAGRFDAAIWLRILACTVDANRAKEEQATGWAHLHRNVRFVCKDLYLVCMNLLRSHYIDQYTVRVRVPYSTDPFPTGQTGGLTQTGKSSGSGSGSGSGSSRARTLRDSKQPQQAPPPLYAADEKKKTSSKDAQQLSAAPAISHRELRVLDLFVAAAVRAALEAHESELYMSSEGYGGISRRTESSSTSYSYYDDEDGQGDSMADLFALHQPRSRLEDLVIARAAQHELVSATAPLPERRTRSSQPAATQLRYPLAPSCVAVDLRLRTAALRLPAPSSVYGAFRTALEVPRQRDEPLEVTSRSLVRQWATIATR